MKIWICGKLGVRNWIDVVLAIHCLSVVDTTLPLPDVLISSKLTIANQVSTAITFMIEFTGTLIEDELEELIIVGKVACPYIRSMRALTKLVDPNR